jgi:dihydropteroate synthase
MPSRLRKRHWRIPGKQCVAKTPRRQEDFLYFLLGALASWRPILKAAVTPDEILTWLHKASGAIRRPPLLMGILNITPDSFSDGGAYQDITTAVRHAKNMATAGAALIDIGGESTRPGSSPVPSDEQIRRVVPVVTAIRKELAIAISIDTTKAAVAAAALDAGANWINDTSAGRDDPAMFPLAAHRKAPIILMHMQGTPATMQANPTYRNVTAEIVAFLRERLDSARTAGIDPADVLLDPGIGFGKTSQQSLQLLRDLDQLTAIRSPLVVGTSRKSFISKITGETGDRLMGTAASVAWAVANGAAILRVHDVEAMNAVVGMIEAIRGGNQKPETRNPNE